MEHQTALWAFSNVPMSNAPKLKFFAAQVIGGPPETRTPDPLIKSQLLYQLS